MKKSKLKINEFNIENIEKISKKFDLTKISARVLLNRKLEKLEDINEWGSPHSSSFLIPCYLGTCHSLPASFLCPLQLGSRSR